MISHHIMKKTLYIFQSSWRLEDIKNDQNMLSLTDADYI